MIWEGVFKEAPSPAVQRATLTPATATGACQEGRKAFRKHLGWTGLLAPAARMPARWTHPLGRRKLVSSPSLRAQGSKGKAETTSRQTGWPLSEQPLGAPGRYLCTASWSGSPSEPSSSTGVTAGTACKEGARAGLCKAVPGMASAGPHAHSSEETPTRRELLQTLPGGGPCTTAKPPRPPFCHPP